MIYRILVGVALVGGLWYGVNYLPGAKYEAGNMAGKNEVSAKSTAAPLQLQKEARLKEQGWQDKLKDANDAATKRENDLRAAARTESERLRGDIVEF